MNLIIHCQRGGLLVPGSRFHVPGCLPLTSDLCPLTSEIYPLTVPGFAAKVWGHE